MGSCYVVGAGEFTSKGFFPQAEDLVIAADGGYDALHALGVQPHLLVGDMDSLSHLPVDIPTFRAPVEKDDTDMSLALEAGCARGFKSFVIYGGGGGRMDHFWANLQEMGRLSRCGYEVRMVCCGYEVIALTGGVLKLPSRAQGTLVSVFCHGEQAKGVSLEGLKYPLVNATLTCDKPLGVSNEYTGETACVTVENGTLLIIVFNEPQA